MANRDLVNGQKEILLEKIVQLRTQYSTLKWRKLLKELDSWHREDQGRNAWENIRKKTTGNEALRVILRDMETIIANQHDQETKNPPPDPMIREKLIASSLMNLQSKKKNITSKHCVK
jgi:hypothetical protein